MHTARILLAAALSLAMAAPAEAKGEMKRAEALFERYVALWGAFDPAVADLYADGALIRNTRWDPDGGSFQMDTPADEHRRIVRGNMDYVRSRNDRHVFSNVTYTAEGARVRIRATRTAQLSGFSFPHELLVGPGPDGRWLIYEEITESKRRPKKADASCKSCDLTQSDAPPAAPAAPEPASP